jgi:glucan phosphoethanolaminetransferase (alkaline phosphatase superfamily)
MWCAERGVPVHALSLLAVVTAARLAVLWGRPLPLSAWTPVAFLWQDIALVLLFSGFERVVRNVAAARLAYAAVVLVIAANVSVGRVLSTPLTAPLLRAARGTLLDSLLHHATPDNIVLTALVLALATGMPWVLHRRAATGDTGTRATRLARFSPLGLAVLVVLLGPSAAARIDTAGLERNGVLALLRSTVPRVRAEVREADWRASPFAADSHTEVAVGADPRPRNAVHADLRGLRRVARDANVVVIALESTAAQYLRPYGAAEDPAPNLTALASRSFVFGNAYAVFPESVKGLVPLLASRYPGFDIEAEAHAPLMTPSLATVLRAQGYTTALFHSGRFMYLGMERLVTAAGFDTAEDAGDIGGNRNSSFGVDEHAAVSRILAWLDALPRGRRFFITYLPIAAHHPYAFSIEPRFPADDDLGRYRNAILEGDFAIGELLDGVRARGLDGSTLIAIVGDHGEAFGQHRGNYGHNLAIYDENVRVPFVLHVPDSEPLRVDRPASLIDLAPTLLDLLGVEAPESFEGASLLDGGPRMALFFTDYSLGLLGLRDGCIKSIFELESGRSRMFDVCTDPGEREDIAMREPRRAGWYRQRLLEWSAAQVARVTAVQRRE